MQLITNHSHIVTHNRLYIFFYITIIVAVIFKGGIIITDLFNNHALDNFVKVISINNILIDKLLIDRENIKVYELEKSISELERVRGNRICNIKILNNLGLIYTFSDLDKNGLSLLEQSDNCLPESPITDFRLGISYFVNDQRNKAISAWQESNASSYFIQIGGIYSEEGEHGKALTAYKIASEIKPLDANVHYSLGWEYQNLKQWENAISEYSITTELDPKFARAYNGWGASVYAGEKNIPGAIQVYKKAIEVDPTYFDVTMTIGDLYAEIKNYSEALDWYLQADKIEPTKSMPLQRIGYLYKTSGDFDNAIIYFQKVLFLDPINSDVYASLGDIYRQKGEYEQALEYIHKAISIKNVLDYHLILAHILRDSGFKQQAINEYKVILSTDPDDVTAKAELESLLK
jgi:tetratricopeptide (TPR) repeat protein